MHRNTPLPVRFASFACACALVAFAVAPDAAAAEWHVSTSGDDGNGDGSLQRPFRTLGHAVDAGNGVVAAGDTVILHAAPGNGRYEECIRLRIPLTIRAREGERPHVHCPLDTTDTSTIRIDAAASGSRLIGLEISGGHEYGVMMHTDWYAGGGEEWTGASDVLIEDLLIHHTGRDGIKIAPRADRVTIRRTRIHDTGARYPAGTPAADRNADGIDNVNGSRMVVEDSHIHDIPSNGLYFKGGAGDVVVQRNRVEDIGAAGIRVGFDTSPEFFDLRTNPEYYEAVRGIVRNNVVRNTRYAGIAMHAAREPVIANNTLVDTARDGQAAIFFGLTFQDGAEEAGRPATVGPRIVNNIVSQRAGGDCVAIAWSDEHGGLPGLAGATGMDWNGYQAAGGCRFVDQRSDGAMPWQGTLEQWRLRMAADAHSIAGDFRLDAEGRPAAGSAAAGAGAAIDEVVDDFDGRPRDGAPGLGAFLVEGAATAGAVVPAAAATLPAAAPDPGVAAATPAVLLSGPGPLAWLLAGLGLVLLALGLLAVQLVRRRNVAGWLPAYLRQDWRGQVAPGTTRHLMFCFVDHYEPAWRKPPYEREVARVARWHQELPRVCAGHVDADGSPPVHTFFYPEEEYRPEHIDRLVDLCRAGLGEIEIHLHHDHDTEAGFREKLSRFTRILANRHGALPVDPVTGQPRWAFIHGNWALDNSDPSGRHCGLDNELTLLREEGCYADFTLPCAPNPCQTSTINRIYYAKDDPSRPKSHDRGPRVRVGGAPEGDLMIIQGPLGLRWRSRKFGIFPRIENSDVRTSHPPTRDRIDAWVRTGIHVEGRPEWIFVKIHTHGAEEHDMDVLLGPAMDDAFSYLESRYNDGRDWKLHYVSAREAYNIARAAEAGVAGEPGEYRDFVIPRPACRESMRGAA